jgi:hypothetical protein
MAFSSWFSKGDDKTQSTELKQVQAVTSTLSAMQQRLDSLEQQLKEATRYQTIFYYDGSLYHGEVKDWQPHGYGTIFYSYGTRYVGEWKNGLFDGKGTLYRDAYSPAFHGEWKQHKAHGPGSYDGMVYETYEDGVCVSFK